MEKENRLLTAVFCSSPLWLLAVAVLAACVLCGCVTSSTVASVNEAENIYKKPWPQRIMTANVNGVEIKVDTKFISNPPEANQVLLGTVASLQQQIRGHKEWHKTQENAE